MGRIYHIYEARGRQPADSCEAREPDNTPLNTLATLICQAQEKAGYLEPEEVLELAAAAKEAIDSLLADIEQAAQDAMQDAVFEVLLAKGSA